MMFEILLAAGFLVVAVASFLALIYVMRITRRYEQFRQEAAFIFGEISERQNDQDLRLMAAGYPPGRTQPTAQRMEELGGAYRPAPPAPARTAQSPALRQ